MSWVPAIGCKASIFASRASAGGQLEQPSEVNNSTRTGVVEVSSAAVKCVPELAALAAKRKARVRQILRAPLRIWKEPTRRGRLGQIRLWPTGAIKVASFLEQLCSSITRLKNISTLRHFLMTSCFRTETTLFSKEHTFQLADRFGHLLRHGVPKSQNKSLAGNPA